MGQRLGLRPRQLGLDPDLGLASKVASHLQYGCTWINTHFMLTSEMPHGGMKMSGYGKDLSLYALEDYTVPRHIMVKLWAPLRPPENKMVPWGHLVLHQVCASLQCTDAASPFTRPRPASTS